MGRFFDTITEEQANLIKDSHIFFVASASVSNEIPPEGAGPVNISPKGASLLVQIDAKKVAYLDYPGSGNETARHICEGQSVTVMVMSTFAKDAAIVRLYGRGSIFKVEDYPHSKALLATKLEGWPDPRQTIEINVERTQTSCGGGVPVFEFIRNRTKSDSGKKYRTLKPTS